MFKVTPLHNAFRLGNNRSQGVLLKYMAKSAANSSETISDILPDLIEQHGFRTYMDGLPTQSIQMVEKQTMKIENCYSDEIVAILPSSTSYVDNEYYRTIAKEDVNNPSFKNYPVSVTSISIDWIINMD